MSVELTIQILLALGTIVGGLVAAIATYRSTNSSVRVQEKQVRLDEIRTDREIKRYGVEEAERISNISITNAQFMQQLLNEATQTKDRLQLERDQAVAELNTFKVKQLRFLSRIRVMYNQNDVLLKQSKEQCPGYEIIQDLLETIISEMENGLEIQ
jgi:hypothetical protein